MASEVFVDPSLVSYLQNISITQPTDNLIPVVVSFNDRDKINDLTQTIENSGGEVKFIYQIVDAIAVDIPSNYVEDLIKNNNIKGVYLDRKIQVDPSDKEFEKKIHKIAGDKKDYLSSDLNFPMLYYSKETIGTPFVWNNGIDGSGIKVAVLDTGIDKTHPDLSGKVVAERDFTLFDNKLDPSDGYGHGTHCAGIIAGSGDTGIIDIDTTSTDVSDLSHLPSTWIQEDPFNVDYHTSPFKIFESDVFSLVTKSAAMVNSGPIITDSFIDFPLDWVIIESQDNIYIEQPEGNTLSILGDKDEIKDVIVDGSSVIDSNGNIQWGNALVKYQLGKEENEYIPLGAELTISGGLKDTINKYDLPELKDGSIEFQGDTYNFHEEIQLGSSSPSIETSLSGFEDDYKTKVFMESLPGSIGYQYNFDSDINISDATSSQPLEIEFLGRKMIITSVSDSNTFTAFIGDKYNMNVGDSVIVEGKTVTLEDVEPYGAVQIDIDGISYTVSGTETCDNIEISVWDFFYSETISERSAVLIMGKQAVETYNDGDSYIKDDNICNDDPEDTDCWEWDVSALTTDSPILRIKNDFVKNDYEDNPPTIGECYTLPNDYVKICLDGLTVREEDYNGYEISHYDGIDLNVADGCGFYWGTAESVFSISSEDDEGIQLDFDSTSWTFKCFTSDIETKRVYLNVRDGDAGIVDVFYKNSYNDLMYAGYITNDEFGDDNTIGYINYYNTQGTDITLDLEGNLITNDFYLNLDNSIISDDDIKIWLYRSGDDFISLGSIGSTGESLELKWNGRNIGTKDEDLRTKYGIIIRNPSLYGSWDEVDLDIPKDQVKAIVSVSRTKPEVKIAVNDYNVVYLDLDGDFSEHSVLATDGQYFKDRDGYNSTIINMYTNPDGSGFGFALDNDYDGKPDLFRGIAPGVQLLNGKVLSDEGYGFDSGIVAGIEWAVLNGADIISMSLGGWESICDGSDPMSQAVDKASDMGVTVVVAAGNSGRWGDETIGSPACAKNVITVGASSKYSDYIYIADFSSRGPTSDGRIKPEILAPGIGIISARASGTSMGQEYSDYYTSASGTSMATPHVAGAVALLKQVNKDLSPDEIKTIIMNSATDLEENVFSQGSGLINVSKAYEMVIDSQIFSDPSEISVVVESGTSKQIPIMTSLNSPIDSVVTFDKIIVNNASFSGVVDSISGFDYSFYISEDDVRGFTISIEWEDELSNKYRSLNDIDMYLLDPNGEWIGGSYGVTNYESITIDDPMNGTWKLVVYPFNVDETKMVNGILSLLESEEWDWVTFDSSNKQIIISPDTETGLYSGKMKLASENRETMIPLSVIVSQPTSFQTSSYHTFVSNPCSAESSSGSGESAGAGGGGAGGSASTDKLYASFDGYFCDMLNRKAYSFEIPNSVPYFNIFIYWWSQNQEDTWSDIRLFIYDPEGNIHSSDMGGNIEQLWFYEPMPGTWTVVVESEYVPIEGIQYSGDISYPIMDISLDFIEITLKPGETKTMNLNVTNFLLGKDLQINTEKDVWGGTPIEVTPASQVEENQTLGPFLDSYKYYHFDVTEDMVSGNSLLKTSVMIQNPSYYSDYLVYIFDANGTMVRMSRIWEGNGMTFDYLSNIYEVGQWTAVIVGEGLSYEQTPFELNVWALEKSGWDWSFINPINSGYFSDDQTFTLTITAPDVESDDFYAGVYLSGAWYSRTDSTHTLYLGLYPRMIPIFIHVRSPPEVISYTPVDGTRIQGSNIENFSITYIDDDLDEILLFWKKSTDISYSSVKFSDCSSGENQSCSKTIDLSGYGDGDNIVFFFEISDKSGSTIETPISNVIIDRTIRESSYNLFIDTITPLKTTAMSDGTDYWEYEFNITIIGANGIRMKLGDWVSGGSTIQVNGNAIMKYSSINGEKTYNVRNDYNETEEIFDLLDEDSTRDGIQSSLILKMTLPSDILPGSYKSTYGLGVYNV